MPAANTGPTSLIGKPSTLLRTRRFFVALNKQKALHFMIWPTIVWLIIFCYYPMYGIQIAFRNFTFNKGITGSDWVGFKFFTELFTDPQIPDALYNTLGMSILKVFLIFPLPIMLAVLLNELRSIRFKKLIQTVSYFPYFISFVVIAFMATVILSPSTGFVNAILLKTGIIEKPYLFLGDPKAFWWISLSLDAWKNTGWGSIIYLAAITGIDPQMYEAAHIDGANRLHCVFNITIPLILPTIMTLFILNVGYLLGGGLYAANFDISYLLGNNLNSSRSQILDIYIFRTGMSLGRYSYAAAVGLANSILSTLLLLSANYISKITTKESFF